MSYQFWIPFIVLFAAVAVCERKWCMLRDLSKAQPQPYSWSRVQLAWWTIIILSSFIAILWKSHTAPELSSSSVILLGISALTTATARVIDVADVAATGAARHQDDNRENFFLDILSDHNGVSISRFQTVVFNLVFGIWFITVVVNNLAEITNINTVMPIIDTNNLILLGLSSATYAAIKTSENKEKKQEAAADITAPAQEPNEPEEIAVG